MLPRNNNQPVPTNMTKTTCDVSPRLGFFGLVSLLPEVFSGWNQYGVIGRAIEQGTITVDYENPRQHSQKSAASVDEKPFGGGPGMVMQLQPVCDALQAMRSRAPTNSRCILLAPHGRELNQQGINELLLSPGIIFLCGRYEGIDSRIEQQPEIETWSVGNFVLSGGELAAMTIIESLARHLPGVLGDSESARQDSFINDMLDYPHYTRPASYQGVGVPRVLTRGNHKDIAYWRHTQALGRMWDMRPDLVHNLAPLSRQDWSTIYQYSKNKQKSK